MISENLEVHTVRVRGHSYQFLNLRPETHYSVTIWASTEAGEGPPTSERIFVTPAALSTETAPEPTTTLASSVTTLCYSANSSHRASKFSDETTLSAPEVTHESSTTTDPTTDGDNDSGVDSLRVAADGGPLALSIAAIAAIALACTLLITILALIVICMCFCVYDCRRKRKPYTVNEQKSKAPPINLAIANRIFVWVTCQQVCSTNNFVLHVN